MKGKAITKKQVIQMKRLLKQGHSKKDIAQMLNLGYSTICYYLHCTKKEKAAARATVKTSYSINTVQEDFDFISNIADKQGITKTAAMQEVVRLARRKCLFSWR
jgi:predicted transcriptional regulator